MHLNGILFEKLFEYCGSQSFFSREMFHLVSINRFHRLRLTFDLSAKVAHIGVPSTYLNIVFSETTKPNELKFHISLRLVSQNLYKFLWSHD